MLLRLGRQRRRKDRVLLCRTALLSVGVLTSQVQAGGSFDIDYIVKDPHQKVLLDGEKERQGDFVFTAQQSGEYSFCFSNDMSTFAEKLVDFEITVPETYAL